MRRSILAVVLLPMLLVPLSARANPPVGIEFLQPQQSIWQLVNLRNTPTQFQSGWPMTIRLTMRNEESLATTFGPPFFPNRSATGYVIFSDPDGCVAMDSLAWAGVPEGCPDVRPPSDEVFIEFTPDVDDVGLPDDRGNPARIAMLIDEFSGGQEINSFPAPNTVTIGPRTSVFEDVFDGVGNVIGSEEIIDGYGFGADDDIVGLVLVAEHGAGIVYDANGNRKAPLELNNLAGFTNSVSYELNSLLNRTTVSAHIVVPPLLLAPLVIADECVGDVAACEIDWRVDGAPRQPAATVLGLLPSDVTSTFENYSELFDGTVYKINAMVVSGTAPDTVVDMNGNGRIDRGDLQDMGYEVLSRNRALFVRQLRGDPCNGGVEQVVAQDFDGNGIAVRPVECPASPVGKSSVPR